MSEGQFCQPRLKPGPLIRTIQHSLKDVLNLSHCPSRKIHPCLSEYETTETNLASILTAALAFRVVRNQEGLNIQRNNP